jgi:hypothetical protein
MSGTMIFNSSLVNESLGSNSSITTSSAFEEWRPNNQSLIDGGCSCHIEENYIGSGSIDITGSTSVETVTNFNLQLKVSSFSQAQSRNIVMGFNYLDNNNSLFTAGGLTLFKSAIAVDGSGNSNNADFEFTSPQNAGNYSLLVYAIYSKSATAFSYLSKVIDITVTPVNDVTNPVINSLLVNDNPYTNCMTIKGSTNLKANVTDNYLSSVSYTTDNKTYLPMNINNITNLYEAEILSNSFSGSSVVLTISALDKGSHNTTNSYCFTLNNTGLLPDADIITFKIESSIIINDGEIDPLWDSIQGSSVSEFGSGGLIKTAQDGMYIYTLLVYDPQMKWISIEFNKTDNGPQYMNNNQDAWVFGEGESKYYGDYYFIGMTASPAKDARNDVFYELIVKDGLNYIEAARLLNTGDIAGDDFVFTESTTISVVFASSSQHKNDHQIMTWAITNISPTNTDPNNGGTISDIKNALDLREVSDIVFVISFIIVIATVFIHIGLRVVSKPIKHEKRIIYTNKIPNQPSSMSLIKNFLFKPKKKEVEIEK